MKNIRFYCYLAPHWPWLAIMVVLNTLSASSAVINPYLTKLFLDKAYVRKDLKYMITLAAVGTGIFLFTGLVNMLSSIVSRYLNKEVYLKITKDFFGHLQRLPWSFHSKISTGSQIYRMNNDVKTVSDFVCNAIPQVITTVPRLLFTLGVIFAMNAKVAGLAAALAAISFAQSRVTRKVLMARSRKEISSIRDLYVELQEHFSHMRLVKALGKEDSEEEKFAAKIGNKLNAEFQNSKFGSISGFVSSIIDKTLVGIVALYGSYLAMKGQMELGSLAAITLYVGQLTGLVTSVVSFYNNTIVSSLARNALSDVFDVRPSITDHADAADYHVENGRIEFKDVVFGYEKDRAILENLTFSIGPADKVAVVGPTGCGKTTLVSLILRLYEPEKGAISVDGVDIRKIRLSCLKSQVGVALQEPFLWNDTIGNNIGYAKTGATDEEVIWASRISDLHDFVSALPDKYDAVPGEMACAMSQGQKQKIAIARSLINKPKILILDEAMASIDPNAEARIVSNIRRELVDSTIIVVSHRFSTVQAMDSIYFLENPSKIDIGTHDQLAGRNAEYAKMFPFKSSPPQTAIEPLASLIGVR